MSTIPRRQSSKPCTISSLIIACLLCCVMLFMVFVDDAAVSDMFSFDMSVLPAADGVSDVAPPCRCWSFGEGGNDVNGNTSQNINNDLCTSGTDLSHCNVYVEITHRPAARLGNHMFFLTVVLGMANRQNIIPVLAKSSPLRQVFDLPAIPDIVLSNKKTFEGGNFGKYYPELEHLDRRYNWSLHGYFQSWQYFDSANQLIRNTFKVKETYMSEVRRYLQNVSISGYQNVCIHVRRGDILKLELQTMGFAVANMTFINNAMTFYTEHFKTVQFIVLSNDISWCKKNIHGKHVRFSPFQQAISDMALMMSCDHVIVTSGSFGWWGAWLSGGTTAYYSGYPTQGSALQLQFNKYNYYPPNWIAL